MSSAKETAAKVAEKIIALMEQGELPPWRRGWQASGAISHWPCNAVSGHLYRSMNYWLTLAEKELQAYDDHRWLTYRQAIQAGGHVRRGEKGLPIIFWKPPTARKSSSSQEQPPQESPQQDNQLEELDNHQASHQAGRGKPQYGWVCRLSHVFNVQQTEDCRLKPLPTQAEPPPAPTTTDAGGAGPAPNRAAQAVIDAMPNPPAIRHHETGNQPAAYNPAEDRITLPDISRFPDPDEYHATLFHELAHATSHPQRLNRIPLESGHPFGSHEYGQEELLAEMTGAILGQLTGLRPATLQNQASYLSHWLGVIKADPSILLYTASQAQKAAEHIAPSRFNQLSGQHRPAAVDELEQEPMANAA